MEFDQIAEFHRRRQQNGRRWRELFNVLQFVVAMEVEFGTSSKGKQTVIYRSFEYVKERDNQNGSTAWRCQKH